MVGSRANHEEVTALGECYRYGWLHTNKLAGSDEIAYVFPSQLHHWFVGWKLSDDVPTIPLKINSSSLQSKLLGSFL